MNFKRFNTRRLMVTVCVAALTIGLLLAGSEAIDYISGPDLEPIFNRGSAVLRARAQPIEEAQWLSLAAAYRASRSRGIGAICTLAIVMAAGLIALCYRIYAYIKMRRLPGAQVTAGMQFLDGAMSTVLRVIAASAAIAVALYLCMVVLAIIADD
jgi:hypothetical protein